MLFRHSGELWDRSLNTQDQSSKERFGMESWKWVIGLEVSGDREPRERMQWVRGLGSVRKLGEVFKKYILDRYHRVERACVLATKVIQVRDPQREWNSLETAQGNLIATKKFISKAKMSDILGHVLGCYFCEGICLDRSHIYSQAAVRSMTP